ncbi:MAG: stage II sporulation protein M [Candidatus Woesearchaeota archaeon]
MVLERLIDPKGISAFWKMFLIGGVYAFFSIVLSYWVFQSYVSIIMVSLTAIAAVPFVYRAIEVEEGKEKKLKRFPLLREHSKAIGSFTFLFLGFVFIFLMTYLLLPKVMVEDIFRVQIDTIITINTMPTGHFISSLSSFVTILSNNLKIMFFCLLFSVFYGMGAIFILSWNASVMGAAIGETIRQGLSSSLGSSFTVISTSLMGYFVHGIPEIVAYFVAGLAGGIISIAAIQEKIFSKNFFRISKGSINLIGIALLLLIISALIEVTISPLFF